jgi:hypothetical protein
LSGTTQHSQNPSSHTHKDLTDPKSQALNHFPRRTDIFPKCIALLVQKTQRHYPIGIVSARARKLIHTSPKLGVVFLATTVARFHLYLHLCSRLYVFQNRAIFPSMSLPLLPLAKIFRHFRENITSAVLLTTALVELYPTTAYVSPKNKPKNILKTKSNTQSWNARLVSARSRRIFSELFETYILYETAEILFAHPSSKQTNKLSSSMIF